MGDVYDSAPDDWNTHRGWISPDQKIKQLEFIIEQLETRIALLEAENMKQRARLK